MWEWAGARQGGTAAISMVTSSNVASLAWRPEGWPSELLGPEVLEESQGLGVRYEV